MTDTIIVALITGICSVIGQRILAKKSDQEKALQNAVFHKEIEDRISNLEKMVRVNETIETQLTNIEKTVIEMKKDIEYLKKGIK